MNITLVADFWHWLWLFYPVSMYVCSLCGSLCNDGGLHGWYEWPSCRSMCNTHGLRRDVQQGRYSYFNTEIIQISDIEIMNDSFCSSGYFESIIMSNFIINNIYKDKSINMRSKPTPIHGTVHKS